MSSSLPSPTWSALLSIGLAAEAAVLAVPVTLDVVAPFAGPRGGLLFLGVLAAGAGLPIAIYAIVRGGPTRGAGLAALVGLGVVAASALTLGPIINYAVGGRAVAAGVALLALTATAIVSVWRPTQRLLWIGVAPAVIAGIVSMASHATSSSGAAQAEHLVRSSARLAPGYGPTSLGCWLGRRLTPEPDLIRRMQEADEALQRAADDDAAAPWNDDARLLHAWLQLKLAAVPGLPEAERRGHLRAAAAAQVAFAANENAQLEPWTSRGILAAEARTETADLMAGEELRVRIAVATEATRQWLRPDIDLQDPDGELEAHAQLRALYEDNGLDLTHALYVASIIVEAGRYKERQQWDRLEAFYDQALTHPWPPELQRPMERERDLAAAALRDEGRVQ